MNKHKGLSILIVDNKHVSSVLRKDIIGLGHIVTVADKYAKAVQMVKKNCFDLIIMDAELPDGDCASQICKIREIAGDVNIVTMISSNNRDIECILRKQRVIYYIIKPFDLIEITEIIEHISRKKTITDKGQISTNHT